MPKPANCEKENVKKRGPRGFWGYVNLLLDSLEKGCRIIIGDKATDSILNGIDYCVNKPNPII